MIDIDTRGTPCPIPLIRTMDGMKKHPADTLAVLVDGHTPKENVSNLAERKGYAVEITPIENGFRLVLTPKK
jgi:TusA-related sulfurtransferase